ncbi:esterase-like activity of phytase family protein [Reyranella sp.]|uniref:esterase-like activity of phytase family protein n=1 Tax=Reyranella sp. TaxID=1929291 RepID=UPI003BA9D968
MRAAFHSLLVAGLLAACAGSSPPPAVAQDQPLEIGSSSLPLKIDEPAARKVGRLVWRGGVTMTANSRRFGGWSDLHITADGKRLTSISDEGAWLTATIEYDGDANLAGLSDARIGQLLALDGRFIASKPEADAEAMARLPDGSWLVAFERNHRLWRYDSLTATPQPVAGPPDIGRQPSNGGIEAMTVLDDGRIVMLSEEYSRRPGTVAGWIAEPAPGGGYRWSSFDYAEIPDFHPTALTRLPDGSLAVVERAFDMARGVRCRVMRFDAAQLVAGGTVRAEELARLASPYAVDNLEGLAATRGARGETLLWLISDDNFNPLQRNILLLFELAP